MKYNHFLCRILLIVSICVIGCNDRNEINSGVGTKIKQSFHHKKDSIPVEYSLKQVVIQKRSKKTSLQRGISDCTFSILNDYFSNNIIDVIGISKKGLSALCKKSFKIQQIAAKSSIDVGRVDTSFLIVSNNSKILFHNLSKNGIGKIPSWEFAEINDDSFFLKSNIHIGMKKNDFLLLFNKKDINCDTIAISDEEQMSSHIFVFANNKLKKINLSSGDE